MTNKSLIKKGYKKKKSNRNRKKEVIKKEANRNRKKR